MTTSALPSGLDRQALERLYGTVATIRAAELKLRAHIAESGFGGFWHPGIGQEGLQAGAVAALGRDDYLFYAHRGLGYALAKGMALESLFGDLLGRTSGSTGGKGGGTVHFADPAVGVLGQGGTLGSNFVLGAGAAMSTRLLGEDRVTAIFFGDGAAARGTFHEAALPAATMKLPLVWICENNGWAISAPFSEHSPTEHVADRAAAYGVPGVIVDGQDTLAVYEAVRAAVERARAGEGPTLVEAKTLRIRGHYEGDTQKYRDDIGDVDGIPDDPIPKLRELIDAARWEELDAEATAAVDRAFAAALAAPRPEPDVIWRDVWSDPDGTVAGAPAEEPAIPADAPRTSYARAINSALAEEMRRDERVWMMGQDIGRMGGVFGVTRALVDEFGPERVRDTAINETFIVGAAAGAAITGTVPVVELQFADFLLTAGDEIFHKLAKWGYMHGGQFTLPVVVRLPTGVVGGAGAEHSQSLEALAMHVPGLKVVLPATPADAKGLLKTAIRDPDPVLFFEHKGLYREKGPVPDGDDRLIPFGKAAVRREGGDLTVVATGLMVGRALAAAERLAAEGVELCVIDPRTLVPLDVDTIVASVERTSRALVVHEAVRTAGPGAEIAAQITERAFFALDAPVWRLGGTDTPLPQDPELEQLCIPGEDAIVAAARALLAL